MGKLLLIITLAAATTASASNLHNQFQESFEYMTSPEKTKQLRDKVLKIMTYYCSRETIKLEASISGHGIKSLGTSVDSGKGIEGVKEYNQTLDQMDAMLAERIDTFLQRCYWVLK